MALVSVGVAKSKLGVSSQSVRRFINSGQLIASKSDTGRWMIDEETLDNLIVSRKTQHSKVPIATPKATDVAKKDNIGIVKPIPQRNIEPTGARLAKEITLLHGARPAWEDLYSMILCTKVNLDGYTLSCCYKTPENKIECFHSLPAYALPDDANLFWDEVFIDWNHYDLDFYIARDYVENRFRWWMQLLYRDKVVIRSTDESAGIAGLWNWADGLEQQEVNNQKWLKAKDERRNRDAKIALGVTGGLLALVALISR